MKCGVEIETDPELLSTLQNHERLQVINSLWSYKVRG